MTVNNRLYRAVDEAKHLYDDDGVPPFRPRPRRPRVAMVTLLALGIVVVVGGSFVLSKVGGGPYAIDNVPGAQTESSTTPVLLPDGTRLVLSHPADLNLGMWHRQSWLVARLQDGEWEGCGALLDGRPTELADFREAGRPLSVLEGRDGVSVALWPASPSTGADTYVVFDFDEWTVGIPFSYGDACPPEELGPIWAGLVKRSAASDGYLVFDIDPPAVIDERAMGGPQIILTDPVDSSTSVGLSRFPCESTTQPETVGGQHRAILCLGAGQIRVEIVGQDSFVEVAASEFAISELDISAE